MGKGKISVMPIVELVAAVLLLVGMLTFAGPCGVHDDGTVSPCFGTSHILAVMGAVAAVVAVVRLFVKNPSAHVALGIVAGALGVAIALAPGNFLALCMMATMRCQTIMKPAAIAMGIVILAAAVIDVFLVRRAQADQSRRPVKR